MSSEGKLWTAAVERWGGTRNVISRSRVRGHSMVEIDFHLFQKILLTTANHEDNLHPAAGGPGRLCVCQNRFVLFLFLSIEPNEVKLPKTLSLRCTLLPFLPKKEMTSIAWISQQWKRPHQLIGGYSGLTVALLIVTLKALISFPNPLLEWTWELDVVWPCLIHLIFLCIHKFIFVLSHDM